MTIAELIEHLNRIREHVGDTIHVEVRNSSGQFDHSSQLGVLYQEGKTPVRVTLT